MAKAKEKVVKEKVKKEKPAPKKKQSSGSGDNFLALHGEKFAFAVIAILALWLMTKGSGLPPFKTTPDQIKSASAAARNLINTNDLKLEDYDPDLKEFDYRGYADLIKSSLKAEPYQTSIRWEQSLFPEKILRPNIKPLTVENLRAVACVGAIRYQKGGAAAAMQGGAAGAQGNFEDKGESWITVTGLIPIAAQMREYNELLGRSEFTDQDRDVPKYASFEIYRGVVEENGETVWDENPIDLSSVDEMMNSKWISRGNDPVSTVYSVPLYSTDSPDFTMPCPPLVNKAFGMEVTSFPNIPLMSETQKEEMADMLKESEKQNEEMKKKTSRNLSGAMSSSIFDTQSGGKGGSRGQNSPVNLPMMGMPPGMGPGMGMGMNPGMGRTGSSAPKETKVDYYLFRFFDFEAEKGKTYQYKVKLFLYNPNYKLATNLVEDGNSILSVTVASDESKPSNPVSLGSESRILAETVEGAGPGSEPKITIASIYFNTEDAKESIAGGKKMERGQIANFRKELHNPVELSGSFIMQGGYGNDSNKKREKVFVDHESDICIADAAGGEKITGTEYRSPAKMLVLEPTGLLTVHTVSEDKADLTPYQAAAPRR